MGFWIYMLLTVLLIPSIMLGFGSYFIKKAPKEINMLFGYRTNMSTKNKDTWEFAHNFCGKLWRRFGIVLLPFSVIVMAFLFGKDKDAVGNVATALTFFQLIFIFVSIILTEKSLKKTFDKDGNRK